VVILVPFWCDLEVYWPSCGTFGEIWNFDFFGDVIFFCDFFGCVVLSTGDSGAGVAPGTGCVNYEMCGGFGRSFWYHLEQI
jgi:hypothetical protein